ncbi:MAG: hypothetical protein IID45_11430, partial [Planctomycetes bacterium]|nr:hypothetical protein [Planctomycetota bacterium]
MSSPPNEPESLGREVTQTEGRAADPPFEESLGYDVTGADIADDDSIGLDFDDLDEDWEES